VIEATALIIARLQAEALGLDWGLDFAGGHQIDDASGHRSRTHDWSVARTTPTP